MYDFPLLRMVKDAWNILHVFTKYKLVVFGINAIYSFWYYAENFLWEKKYPNYIQLKSPSVICY